MTYKTNSRMRSSEAKADAGLGSRFTHWLVLIVTGFAILATLAPVIYQSFLDAPLYDGGSFTLANYNELLSSERMRQMLANTIAFSAMATVIAVVLGIGVGFLVVRTDMPGRALLAGVFSWPLYTSALVLAFGWVIVYGPAGYVNGAVSQFLGLGGGSAWLYTLPGMALVGGIAEAPLVYYFASRTLRSFNPALEEVARTLGAHPLRIVWTVTIPLLRPAILYSVILVFVAALESLSIPLILGNPSGVEMFASFLYIEGLGRPNPNYGLLAAAAIAMILVAVVLIWLQARILGDRQKYVTVTGKATQPRQFSLGRTRWLVATLLAMFVTFASVIPILGIVLRSLTQILSPYVPILKALTFDNCIRLFSTPSYVSSIQTSLVVALVGALIATALAAAIGVVAHRSSFRFRRPLDFLSLAPRAIPAIVVSIGVFWAMFLFPILEPLRGTLWILVFAFTIRFLPLGIGVIVPALMNIHKDLESASRLAGASWLRSVTSITLRLSTPALIGAYIVLFSHFLREYASAVYLISPGVNVMGTSMLQLWDQGIAGTVAAFAMVQVLLGASVVLIGRKFKGANAHG